MSVGRGVQPNGRRGKNTKFPWGREEKWWAGNSRGKGGGLRYTLGGVIMGKRGGVGGFKDLPDQKIKKERQVATPPAPEAQVYRTAGSNKGTPLSFNNGEDAKKRGGEGKGKWGNVKLRPH